MEFCHILARVPYFRRRYNAVGVGRLIRLRKVGRMMLALVWLENRTRRRESEIFHFDLQRDIVVLVKVNDFGLSRRWRVARCFDLQIGPGSSWY